MRIMQQNQDSIPKNNSDAVSPSIIKNNNIN